MAASRLLSCNAAGSGMSRNSRTYGSFRESRGLGWGGPSVVVEMGDAAGTPAESGIVSEDRPDVPIVSLNVYN